MDNFSKKVEKKLDNEFDKCRKELIKVLLPLVKNNPPEDLLSGIATSKPTKEQAEAYLKNELDKIIPVASEFVKEMKINCIFKDVTYETLCDQDFQTALREVYPYINLPKPMEEYRAVAQKNI